jgi:hypothetical protein
MDTNGREEEDKPQMDADLADNIGFDGISC